MLRANMPDNMKRKRQFALERREESLKKVLNDLKQKPDDQFLKDRKISLEEEIKDIQKKITY